MYLNDTENPPTAAQKFSSRPKHHVNVTLSPWVLASHSGLQALHKHTLAFVAAAYAFGYARTTSIA